MDELQRQLREAEALFAQETDGLRVAIDALQKAEADLRSQLEAKAKPCYAKIMDLRHKICVMKDDAQVLKVLRKYRDEVQVIYNKDGDKAVFDTVFIGSLFIGTPPVRMVETSTHKFDMTKAHLIVTSPTMNTLERLRALSSMFIEMGVEALDLPA